MREAAGLVLDGRTGSPRLQVALRVLAALALLTSPGFVVAGAQEGKLFRFAGQGDVLDLDPHGVDEGLTTAFRMMTYEGLLWWSWDLSLHPSLAESWTQVNPTTWRFRLRRGVRFHDGTPFTADDVVYSLRRARSPNSGMVSYVSTLKDAVRVDDHTVDLVTDGPDPILLQRLPLFFILSRAWAEKNGAANPSRPGVLSPTSMRANGTGPFRLVERVADTRIKLEANPSWWGNATWKHNLGRIEYRPIANAATRVAALLSGEVDMIFPVPPQDVARIRGTPGFRVLEEPDTRTVFLGFDASRAESLDMPGSGKNPFKDVRVRRAVQRAIDPDVLHRKVMRGASRPAALLIGPGINGYEAALDVRPPPDLEAARRLLAEAGYPQGFPVTLDCPNDRLVNDEAICQAVVSMLARLGIKASLHAQTKSKFFQKLHAFQTSMYLMSWQPGTADLQEVLFMVATTGAPRSGTWNAGRYSHPRVEQLAVSMTTEMDRAKRQRLMSEAQRLLQEDVAFVPLHQQMVTWAVRDGVEMKVGRDGEVRPVLIRLR